MYDFCILVVRKRCGLCRRSWRGDAASKLSKKLKNLIPDSKPFSFFCSLCLFYSALIFIFFTASCYKEESTGLERNDLFSSADKSQGISYTIKERESINISNIHRLRFRIEVPNSISNEQIMSIAQKIVKNTIAHEECHSITLDFGLYGYVDFAPYGNWVKAGEIPIDNYKDYKFKYFFFK